MSTRVVAAGGRAASRPGARSRVPTLREERRLLRAGHTLVAGMDEVGRGALAGPVSVGVVVVDASVPTAPAGIRDSKLLTPAAREALVPRLRQWAVAYAVGHAEPAEIDAYGIVAALRLAGRRALASLPQTPSCVLLDGSHDWLSAPRPRRGPGAGGRADAADAVAGIVTEPLFDLDPDVATAGRPASPRPGLGLGALGPGVPGAPLPPVPPQIPLDDEFEVLTQVKADLRCAAVAAASVLAKVERDAIMVARSVEHPRYGWAGNKGYAAPEHLAALAEHGPCEQHRRSWSLPGVAASGGPAASAGSLGEDLLSAIELPLVAPDEAFEDARG